MLYIVLFVCYYLYLDALPRRYVIMETLQRLQLSHAVINIPINASMYHIHERKQPPWVLW